MFESRHVSRHFEKRQRQTARQARKKQKSQKQKQDDANRRRAAKNKRLPKLSLAVYAASHLILAAKATTGLGADHAHFPWLLLRVAERLPVETVLADAGYDSENNHRLAREELGIRTLIPATYGRAGAHGPTGHYRRLMRRRFKRGPDKRFYGQRWQVETVNSMVKRNLGSACRAQTPTGRKKDMLLRAVTHNLMILANF
jgi:hypothetical protein